MRMNKKSVPLTAAKRPGSREHLFGRGNEINANNKKEVMEAIATILNMAGTGEVTMASEEELISREEATAAFVQAHEDRTPNSAWAEIGVQLASDLRECVERQGFMRKIFKKLEVSNGQIPRHRVQQLNVMAVVATGGGAVLPQMVRERFIFPPEFQVLVNLLVTRNDINQTPGDVYDERFQEALQAVMVGEDKTVKACLDTSVGLVNPLTYVSGSLTVAQLSNMGARLLSNGGSTGGSVLLAADYWEDIQTSSSFASYYDPVTKMELIQNGVIGRFFGRDFITDGVRIPTLRVLAPGELYVLADPELVGGYTERGPVESTEVDGAVLGKPGARGWTLLTDLSVAAHNAKTVAKAVRS